MNYALVSLINIVFQVFSFLILVEVIGSWVLAARVQLPGVVYDILRVIHTITEPVLAPIRRILPNMGGLDFSPIIALILLSILQRVIASVLY